jgi:glycosyltransferase involved in cell wall biosynthesis
MVPRERPDCPALLDHLRAEGPLRPRALLDVPLRAVVLRRARSCATAPCCCQPPKKIAPSTLSILERFFQLPAAYIFLTPEEQTLVSTRAGRRLEPSAVIGMGLDPRRTAGRGRSRARARAPYLLYLGRVDRNKGCDTLLEYFVEYASAHDGLSLVLAGPSKMTIPSHPRIRALGRVSDDERDALLQGALALAIPSPFESLSHRTLLPRRGNHGFLTRARAR